MSEDNYFLGQNIFQMLAPKHKQVVLFKEVTFPPKSVPVLAQKYNFQLVYTLIFKNSSQGGVPDGADRSGMTCYVDMFQKEPKIVLGKCQTTK